jgi:hypothetical protein
MAEVGVLARILPAGWAIDRLAGQEADPLRRLAALMLGDEEDARALAHRLHFSRKQRDRLGFLLAPPVDLTAVDDQELRRLLYRWGVERLDDLARLQGATALLPVIGKGAPPPFPLSGRDALDLGVEPGTRVGDLLAAVEAWWIDHDFAGGRKELLAELRRRCGPVEGD